MTNKDRVEKILRENLYMTISVANLAADPWIANLYYAFDDVFNFYWYSPKSAQHSKIISENPRVALAIFDSRAVGDEVDAVYIQAKANEVKDTATILKGLELYAAKMFQTKFISKSGAIDFVKRISDFQTISKLRLYKAETEKFWVPAPTELFNNKYIDSRIEVNMK